MAEKIQRQTQKIFGGKAPTDDLAVFGSFKANNPIYTDNIEDLQSPAYEEGWNAAIIADEAPFLEEMNGLQYGFSKQLAYLFQEGVPEYDINTEYFAGGMAKGFNADNVPVIYRSLTDNNIGNSLSDTTHWAEWISGADIDLSNLSQAGIDKIKEYAAGSGGGLEVCDIGMALYVDESKGLRRYLNGQVVTINKNTQGFLDKLLQIKTTNPELFTTEENWQSAKTLSAFGQVGKFVLNYGSDGVTVESVRIPAIVNVQGLFDLQNLGITVQAGLPNITGGFGNIYSSLGTRVGVFSSSPSADKKSGYMGTGKETAYTTIKFSASDSNPIYGNSETVQEEAIQYPYFIQIATGQETEVNIVNDIELNNPYTLFDSKYSPNALYNASWLKSEGQWNSKTVYVTCYEGLQVEHNTEVAVGTTVTLPSGTSYVKRGLSVKLSGEAYDDYDFVINTADETFRLPLLNGSEDLPGDGNSISYEILASGSRYKAAKNGEVYFSWRLANDNNHVEIVNETSGTISNQISSGINRLQRIFLPVKRGDTFKVGYQSTGGDTSLNKLELHPFKGNGSPYYYVGETVQNANLIDVGRVLEAVEQSREYIANEIYYKPGDVFTSSRNMVCSAFISGSSTVIRFICYLPKRLNNIQNINILSLKTAIRIPSGGYTPASGVVDILNDGLTTVMDIIKGDNSVCIGLKRTDKWANVTNNTPLVIEFVDAGSLTLEFS